MKGWMLLLLCWLCNWTSFAILLAISSPSFCLLTINALAELPLLVGSLIMITATYSFFTRLFRTILDQQNDGGSWLVDVRVNVTSEEMSASMFLHKPTVEWLPCFQHVRTYWQTACQCMIAYLVILTTVLLPWLWTTLWLCVAYF